MAGSRPQSHGDAISIESSLDYCCKFLPTATTTWTTSAAATTTTATTTNKSTATTVLHK